MKSLDEIREQIDAIDDQMRILFEQRMVCIKAVAEYKFNNNGDIFDQNREQKMLKKNLSKLEASEYAKAYEQFLQEILLVSKAYQKDWILSKESDERGN